MMKLLWASTGELASTSTMKGVMKTIYGCAEMRQVTDAMLSALPSKYDDELQDASGDGYRHHRGRSVRFFSADVSLCGTGNHEWDSGDGLRED